jgi:hypothetical protein
LTSARRDTLALAPGELARPAVVVALQANHFERLGHPPAALVAGDLLDLQPVGHVLADRHVREQGVVLEDGVHVALVRRQAAHVAAAELDPAVVGMLEAGDQPQAGRLAGAGWPEHREELVLGDFEIDTVDGDDLAVSLARADEAHGGVPIQGHRPFFYTLRTTGASNLRRYGACRGCGLAVRPKGDIPAGEWDA